MGWANRLLLADDSFNVRQRVREALMDLDLDIVEAIRCADALEKYEAGAFAAAVVGFSLPESGGIPVVRRIRLASGFLPIFVVGREEKSVNDLCARRAGADHYFVESFDPKMFKWRMQLEMRRAEEFVRLDDN